MQRRKGREHPSKTSSGLWSKVRHLRRKEKTEGGDEERWRGIEGKIKEQDRQREGGVAKSYCRNALNLCRYHQEHLTDLNQRKINDHGLFILSDRPPSYSISTSLHSSIENIWL